MSAPENSIPSNPEIVKDSSECSNGYCTYREFEGAWIPQAPCDCDPGYVPNPPTQAPDEGIVITCCVPSSS